jgi:hypothetical protein
MKWRKRRRRTDGTVADHTIELHMETADTESKLERLVALAERFAEAWGDAPLPDGIERFMGNEGDHVLFRYDRGLTTAEAEKLKADIKKVLPGIKPVLLSGGLRLEGIIAGERLEIRSETPFEG